MAKRVTLIDRAIARLEGEITARQHALAVLRELQSAPLDAAAVFGEAPYIEREAVPRAHLVEGPEADA
jgi:hypothetical protein